MNVVRYISIIKSSPFTHMLLVTINQDSPNPYPNRSLNCPRDNKDINTDQDEDGDQIDK